MINLAKKKAEREAAAKAAAEAEAAGPLEVKRFISRRSKMLQKELSELDMGMLGASGVKLSFPDVDDLRAFSMTVAPVEGPWKGGTFHFEVEVPPNYNMEPPKVECKTLLWHPNIDEQGKICLT